jgi:hypothetical protein
VLVFNLVVTAWIGEWLLLATGSALHVILGLTLRRVAHRPAIRSGLENLSA